MNFPKKQCLDGPRPLNVSRLYNEPYFSKLPTAVAVMCLTFLSFTNCSKLSAVSRTFFTITATAQSLMKTTDQTAHSELKPQQHSHLQHFLDAILKKCSPRRLSSLIYTSDTQIGIFKDEVQTLNRIIEDFSKIQTIQMPAEVLSHALLHPEYDREPEDPKRFHQIKTLAITSVCYRPALSSSCPGITTLTLFFDSPFRAVMMDLPKLERLSTLTLQAQIGGTDSSFIRAEFPGLQTTPFKSLKRLNLGEEICSDLNKAWELIGTLAPQLNEMHIFFPGDDYYIERGLRDLRLKICTIHFRASNFYWLANKRRFLIGLCNPEMLPLLERLVVTNVSDEIVESISRARHGVIVNRHCSCEFFGANRASSDYSEENDKN